MTEPKKSSNPFINMANDAKKNSPRLPMAKTTTQKMGKPSKGFAGAPVRKTGRGG